MRRVGGAKALAQRAMAALVERAAPFPKDAPLSVYVADVRLHPRMLREFGLPRNAALPAAVVHDTRRNRRYRTDARDMPLTKASLLRFWDDVLAGRRLPISSKEL
jgi:hypothetical protein